jgi:hypothetical protein
MPASTSVTKTSVNFIGRKKERWDGGKGRRETKETCWKLFFSFLLYSSIYRFVIGW